VEAAANLMRDRAGTRLAANGQTVDESFRSDIRKLLEITGSAQLGSQAASLVAGQLLDGLKRHNHPYRIEPW
jgi:hypothetical protein